VKARIYQGTARNLAYLAGRLRAGELVAVPTETVYGLAADALSAAACRRIFTAKGRPANDPLIVHLRSLRELDQVAEVNAAVLKLAKRFWPGPLTLVLPKKPAIPAVVSSHLPSVAVRMPAHPLFRRLLQLTGRPLAVPSANPFGYLSPTTAAHVHSHLGRKIRHILDGGACRVGVESTIVDLRDPARPRLLRPGQITREQIQRVLGVPVALGGKKPGSNSTAVVAPGQLARHYSPHTPLTLHKRISARAAQKGPLTEAWLLQRRPPGSLPGKNIFWLDASGRLDGAARRLFAVLRRIDAAGFRRIHAELAAGTGLAAAINDRLRRAAAA
jgi:L-threonylcarbamoyladenylate synthase